MNKLDKENIFIKDLTLLFGIVLLFTDVFFLVFGIIYDLPLIRYLIYVKLVINSTNIVLILKKHYLISTVIIYSVILLMMIVGIISLGLKPLFQVYSLGMLVCISYNCYLHDRVLKKQLPMFPTIAIHVISYAVMYIYGTINEPLYRISETGENVLIAFNSIVAFAIVILYVYLYHYVATNSEEKLEKMAMVDNLTGLYNRHYLLGSLESREKAALENSWLAILDIDDFKKVNDTYGHNCGDYILHQMAKITEQVCTDCIVCRWGGEEFIVISTNETIKTDILEKLRKKIESEEFKYEGDTLHITITIGVKSYDKSLSNDSWISAADEKLYLGKKNGKNRVVI
ncbi:MAG: GGDEF domain-containing protein [Lachnospiraceae bacterium]|nr:GGDEF domain-containing protein [Lachnospiraceae bacterium]